MKDVLVVITGPTASGKTGLAIRLAKQFNGEIISADSRAIFKYIDIASAKPTAEEMSGVPHWGIDIVNPGDRFTAADFKKYAYEKIEDIISRGKIPFLVGGTGLYIDAVLNNYQFGGEVDSILRDGLSKRSIEDLQSEILKLGLVMPENHKNKRHLARTIERHQSSKSCEKHNVNPKYSSIVVGITTEKSELRSKINNRVVNMIDAGLIDEAERLADKYGWQSEAMTANAYPLVKTFLGGEITKSELIEKLSIRDWQLAKRQITFMKRNNSIVWKKLEEAEQYISSELNKFFKQ